MKSMIRSLARSRHAIRGNVIIGVVTVVAGWLLQAHDARHTGTPAQISPLAVIVLGIVVIVAASVALVATYLVEPVLVGEIVVAQQPQLPDVRAHAPHMKELAQAA